MDMIVAAQPDQTVGSDLRPRGRTESGPRFRSPAELAYLRLRANPRINPSAKSIAEELNGCCQGEANCVAFVGSRTMAKNLGWHLVSDKGDARVGRSLDCLKEEKEIRRMTPDEFWRWHRQIGGPKLGIRAPKTKGRPRMYTILCWKRPDATAADWEIPPPEERSEPGASVGFEPGANVEADPAPVSGSNPAPVSVTENGLLSNQEFEQGKPHVTPALPPGKNEEQTQATQARPDLKATSPAVTIASEADVAKWTANLRCRGPQEFLSRLALANLMQADRVPVEWQDRAAVIRAKDQSEASAVAASIKSSEAAAKLNTKTGLIEDRVRRLARDAGSFDLKNFERLVRDVARTLHDLHSLPFHRSLLKEIGAKTTKVEDYLIALSKGRAAKKGDGGRTFTLRITPYRGKGKSEK